MPELNDHDLLIRLDQKVENLTQKLDDHLDNTAKQVNDHEKRIRLLERYAWAAIGVLALAELIGFSYIIDKLNK